MLRICLPKFLGKTIMFKILKLKTLLATLVLATTTFLSAEETLTFTPPTGWGLASRETLTPAIKVMVVGKGQNEYPPSINLATENWSGTLKDYLKVIKDLNDAQCTDFKDLGKVKTEAGDAVLTQEDIATKWGDVRQMHLFYLHNGVVYILTAASLKEEFPKYYKEFFNSMTSLRINKGVFEMIADQKRREMLSIASDKVVNAFKEMMVKQSLSSSQVFMSADFQKTYWEPFKTMVLKDYADMGDNWQNMMLGQIQTTMING